MWVDAAASSEQPPAGITGTTAFYGLLGGRLQFDTDQAGTFDLSARGGHGGDRASWLQGDAAWDIGQASRKLAWGVRTVAFGLAYAEPFVYRAFGAGLEPRVSAALGSTVLTFSGDFQRGQWTLGTRPALDTLALSGTLEVLGGKAAFSRLFGPAWVEAGAEAYYGAFAGWFSGVVGSASIAHGSLGLGLNARAWSTPVGNELGLYAFANLAASRAATLRLAIGRSTTDPLYGTPGTFGASVGISVRIGSGNDGFRHHTPVVELLSSSGSGHRARFRYYAPRAHTVALAGDFTDWQPRAMVRSGDVWLLELPVPPGLHHFGFLVNGRDWRVPPDAPGVNADEWGRENATLVVEP